MDVHQRCVLPVVSVYEIRIAAHPKDSQTFVEPSDAPKAIEPETIPANECVGRDEMNWWQQFWPELETEMQRMDREQSMIGQGECQKCNKLAAENNELKMQLDLNHVAFRQREELMQAEIDSLRDEKQDNLCRSEGFNTGNVGD